MENSVIVIESCVITTIVYALLVPVFFEMDNNAVVGEEGTNFVDDDNNDQTMDSQQQVVDTKECKSPCPSSAEMCIELCA